MKRKIEKLYGNIGIVIEFLEDKIEAVSRNNFTIIREKNIHESHILFITKWHKYKDHYTIYGWCPKVKLEYNYNLPIDYSVEVYNKKKAFPIINDYGKTMMRTLVVSRDLLGRTLTLGSDPEIFVEDKDGIIIPAFKFLGGKDKPTLYTGPLPEGQNCEDTTKSRLFWDGFQAEFNTFSDTCLAWVMDSIHNGLRGVLQNARQVDPNAKLSAQTLIYLSDHEMKNTDEKYLEFGCEPSYNIYSKDKTNIGVDGKDTPIRPVGGHLHFGLHDKVKKDSKAINRIVKALDAIVGVACVSLFEKYDHPSRRELYGRAGEYRLPPHGIEYRTLSNAWIYHPLIANLVFGLARRALVFGFSNFLQYFKASEKDIIKAINECDVKLARKIMNDNKEVYKRLFVSDSSAGGVEGTTARFNIFYEGMHNYIEDPTDIEGNWNLSSTWTGHCNKNNWATFSQEIINKRKVS